MLGVGGGQVLCELRTSGIVVDIFAFGFELALEGFDFLDGFVVGSESELVARELEALLYNALGVHLGIQLRFLFLVTKRIMLRISMSSNQLSSIVY